LPEGKVLIPGVITHGSNFVEHPEAIAQRIARFAGRIRLNTELVKKPRDLLEYVIVHEMLHLVEPTHSERFISLLNKHYPTWREARAELNELPLGAARWSE
jgi:hypothetical protein